MFGKCISMPGLVGLKWLKVTINGQWTQSKSTWMTVTQKMIEYTQLTSNWCLECVLVWLVRLSWLNRNQNQTSAIETTQRLVMIASLSGWFGDIITWDEIKVGWKWLKVNKCQVNRWNAHIDENNDNWDFWQTKQHSMNMKNIKLICLVWLVCIRSIELINRNQVTSARWWW